MDIKNKLKTFKEIGIEIEPTFFELPDERIESPLLNGVEFLLSCIDEKGLKLTPKGNLPTKIVKGIVEVASTKIDKQYAMFEKRFYEEDHLSVQITRIITELMELISVKNGKLFLTKKSQKFSQFSRAEKYVFIFDIMMRLRHDYFDHFGEVPIVYNSSMACLQIIRDKEMMYRTAEVYISFLLVEFPDIEREIESLQGKDIFEDDPYEIFLHLMEVRFFKRMYLYLGLVDVEIRDIFEPNKYKKTQMLDHFLSSQNSIDTDKILSRKMMADFQKKIQSQQLEIPLFETIAFLLIQFAPEPSPPRELVIEELIKKDRVIGEQALKHQKFYEELYENIIITLKAFTQLEAVGHHNQNLVNKFEEFIEALYRLVKDPKPYNVFEKVEMLPMIVMDIFVPMFQLDRNDDDFMQQCIQKCGEDMAFDLAHLILLHNQLQKSAKKLKKTKVSFEQTIKEYIQTYIMIVLEFRSMILELR